MTTREQIVGEAKRWVNTPTRLRGRAIGAGVDCVGIWLGIADRLGLEKPEIGYYGDQPPAGFVRGLLDGRLHLTWDRAMTTPAQAAIKPGQLALFNWGHAGAIHMGVVATMPGGRLGLVHAYQPLSRVVEHGIEGLWTSRLEALYDVPEVIG